MSRRAAEQGLSFARLDVLESRQLLANLTFAPELPVGSLSHRASAVDAIGVGETDEFSAVLDAGQTLSLLVAPTDAGLLPTIDVLDPGANIIASASAAGAGQNANLSFVSIAGSGTYTIRVSGAGTAGSFALDAVLNALREVESAGGANDTIGGAEAIDGSSVAAGAADRAGAVGFLDGADAADVYSFTLGAGQTVSLGVSPAVGVDGAVRVDLLDPAGELLAASFGLQGSADSTIASYLAGSAGTYYARVTGTGLTAYGLVVARGAALDRTGNDSSNGSQALPPDAQVFGSLGRDNAGNGSGGQIRVAVQGGDFYGTNVANQLANSSVYTFVVTVVGMAGLDTIEELNNYDVVVMGQPYNEDFTLAASSAIRAWWESGQGGVVGTGWLMFNVRSDGSGSSLTNLDAIIPINLAGGSRANIDGAINILDAGHPIAAGLPTSFSGGWNGEYSTAGIDADAVEIARDNGLRPSVVVKETMSRAAWLSPAFFWDYPTTTGNIDVLLENAVSWASEGGSDRVDYYTIAVNAGDSLSILTSTPFDAVNDPANDLDPILELYSPNGTLVASNNNGGGDGRNALIEYTAGETGLFKVRVGVVLGVGDYVMTVTGATGTFDDPFAVSSHSATGPDPRNTYPSTVTVTFDDAIDFSTLEASDFTVNGVGATSFAVVDGRTVVFDIGALNTGDGLYTLAIADGAMSNLRGSGVGAFAYSFTLDQTPPTVVGTTLGDGQTVAPGEVVIALEFSEELAAAGFDAGDVVLEDLLNGNSYAPSVFDYNPATSVLVVAYADVRDGVLRFRLLSGANAARDLVGNALDGDFDNSAGGDFQINFTVDAGSMAFPVEPARVGVPGSLAYEGMYVSGLHNDADVDQFLLELDAGQTVTVEITPLNEGLTPSVTLSGPSGFIGSNTASGPGQRVVLQWQSAADEGTYAIEVSSAGGEGRYVIRVLLNTGVEQEGSGVGDVVVYAENFDSFQAPGWSADNFNFGVSPSGEVFFGEYGGREGGKSGSFDYDYADLFLSELPEHERVRVEFDLYIIRSWDGNFDPDFFEFYNDFTTLLSTTFSNIPDGEQSFPDPYFSMHADHTGAAAVNTLGYDFFGDSTYRMVFEYDHTLSSFYFALFAYNLEDITNESWGVDNFSVTLLGASGGGGSNDSIETAEDISAGETTIAPGLGVTNVRGTALGGDSDFFRFNLDAGSRNSIVVSGSGFNPFFYLYDPSGQYLGQSTFDVDGNAVVSNFLANSTGEYFVEVSGAGEYTLTITEDGRFALDTQDGSSQFDGDPTVPFLGYLGEGEGPDTFRVSTNDGDALSFFTTTPFANGLFPDNALQTRLELYNPFGVLVAAEQTNSGDGQNTLLDYTVQGGEGGMFTLVLSSVNDTQGAYTLSASGFTGGDPVLGAVVLNPPDGAHLAAFPDYAIIEFSQPVLETSVANTDFTINGVASNFFFLVDARTAWFNIDGLDTGDGLYSLEIAPDAVQGLSGASLDSFFSVFTLDTVLPTVTSSDPASGGVVPAGNTAVSVTFSEELRSASLDPSDFELRDAVTNVLVNAFDSFSYDPGTSTLVLNYTNLAEGSYRMVLLSGFNRFEDLARLPLDGANSGSGSNFVLEFFAEAESQPFPVPTAVIDPVGGLMSSSTAAGVFSQPGDNDAYTIALDAGQVLSARVRSNIAQRVLIEVLDPSDTLLAQVLSSGADAESVLSGVAVGVSGTYTVRVTGLDAASPYTVEAILNAMVEGEAAGANSNDTTAAAEDLAPSLVNLVGDAAHFGVLGRVFNASDTDVYSLAVDANDYVSVVLSRLGGANASFSLLDNAGNLIASGVETSSGGPAGQRLDQVAVPGAGNVFVVVTGAGDGRYSVLATRNAAFDTDPNSSPATAQDISATHRALGSLSGGGAGGGGGGAIRVGVHGSTNGPRVVEALNNDTYFDFDASLIRASNIDTLPELETFDVIVISDFNVRSEIGQFQGVLKTWSESGGGVVGMGWVLYSVTSSGGGFTWTDIDAVLPVNTTDPWNYQGSGVTVSITDGSHPVTQNVNDFGWGGFAEYATVDDDGQVLAMVGSRPAVVVNTPGGNGRSVWIGPTFLDGNTVATNAGADRLVEQAVAWAGSNDREDWYSFTVNDGDTLSLQTTTPFDLPDQPANSLDPKLELYNPSGVLVALDDNSASDGRNARIDYTAAGGEAGLFKVRVLTVDGEGNYTIDVAGATGALPAFSVTNSDPADGALLNEFPSFYTVSFDKPLSLSSVDASDLLINGQAATGVEVLTPTSLRFDIAGLASGDGVYTAALAAGAVSSLSGAPVAEFSATFDSDATAPTVVFSSLTSGQVINPGALVYTAVFSEELATSGLDASDVVLRDTITNSTIGPSSFLYDPATTTLTVSYADVPESQYLLTLLTSGAAFRDRRGNLLDGNSDGTPGDPFDVGFIVDITTQVFPGLQKAKPIGSLVANTAASGSVSAPGDADSFTIALDPGQTASIFVSTIDTLRAIVDFIDPDDIVIASAAAGSPGEDLTLSSVAVTKPGTHTVRVTGADGLGTYSVQVVLNAVVDAESTATGDNDSQGTAQDLAPSSIPLGSDRLAAQGSVQPGDDDWYSFELAAGQSLSAIAIGTVVGSMTVSLFDPETVLVALGKADGPASNIDTFVAAEAGVYALRVSATAAQNYTLAVTRGISLGIESLPTQDISVNRSVLGALDASQAGTSGAIRVGLHGGSRAQTAANQLNNDTFFNFTASVVRASNIDSLAELNQYDVIVISDYGFESEIAQFSPVLRQWVEAGGSVVGAGWLIYAVGQSTGTPDQNINAIMPVDTSIFYQYTEFATLTPQDANHPIMQGLGSFQVPTYAEFSTIDDPNASLLATIGGQPGVVTSRVGLGSSVWLGPIFMNGDGSLTSGLPDRLFEQAVAFAGGDVTDEYTFPANAGDNLLITTATPFDADNQPDNSLDPILFLYDQQGFLVAQDDNSASDAKNAQIQFQVPAGSSGLYRVVVGGTGNGEYVLHAAGSTSNAGVPLTVASASPTGKVASEPTQIDINFSRPVRPDSLDAADLSVTGGTVDGVTLLDADTARFSITVPQGAGVYEYTLAAGTVLALDQTGTDPFAASFEVDKTGPRITAQSPALQASAPFTELTFTFSETIDAATFTTSDVLSFTGPGGSNLIGTLTSVTGSGDTFTVNFSAQNAAGTYVMVIGPSIADSVGNLLDQNQDGTGGTATDRYTATVDLASPDLTTTVVSVPTTAVFGSAINVNWTVKNVGTDPALEAWSDRVYLSTDTTLGGNDRLLFTRASGVAGLGVNETYDAITNPTLPLDVSLQAGTYYIIVRADALSQQPESNENNNIQVSEAISISIPPLPDITVTSIITPVEAFSGQQIDVSWIVTNQGSGDATGTWYDQLFLSPDNIPGGNDQYFGQFDFTGTIPAGQSITRTVRISLPQNLTGNRWAYVRTDVYNHLFEFGLDNNNDRIADTPIDVKLSPLPNLVVSGVTGPTQVFSGTTTQVEWTIQNIGTGPTSAPTWYDRVYISADTVFDASDIYAGQFENISFLAPGDSYANSATVSIPRTLSGTYHFVVITDVFNNVFENTNESDNSGSSNPIDVDLTPPPDLTVQSASVPALAFSGQLITVSYTVVNEGLNQTLESGWSDRIYFSTDNVLNQGDVLLGGSGYSAFIDGPLDIGETYTRTLNATLPIGIEGDFFILVQTDAFNNVFEAAFEDDNISAFAFHVNLTPPPDLEIEDIALPASARAGTRFDIALTVRNFGATVTPNTAWTDTFYLSADQVLDQSDIGLGQRGHFGALEPDAAYTDIFSALLPNGLSGQFYVLAHTDSTNAVFELDNTNNTGVSLATINIESIPANLAATAFSSPVSSVISGGFVQVDWSVTNFGDGDTIATSWYDTVFASSDQIVGNGDDFNLGSSLHVGLLNPSGTYDSVRNVTIPFGLSGQYYLYIRTDTSGSVFESSESDNASPLIPLLVIKNVADLDAQTVSGPTNAVGGDQILVQYTVTNSGVAYPNNSYWYDAIYLSTDNAPGGDTFLGYAYRGGSLAPNESYTNTAAFNLSVDLEGQFFFVVYSDTFGYVDEGGSEANNAVVSDEPMVVVQGPVADLRVVSVDAPTEAITGQDIEFSYSVENTGQTPAYGNWYDTFYLSKDQFLDSSDSYLGYAYPFASGLAPGESYTRTRAFTVPAGLAGPFYLFTRTDHGNYVHERAGETNNTGYDLSSVLVTLAPPSDLTVGDLIVPANGELGQFIEVTFTIHNSSGETARGAWFDSVYISSDDAWDVGDPLLSRLYHVGDVPSGESYSRTFSAKLPGVLPGEYKLIVRSDIKNQLPESNENNNVGASIDRVIIDVTELPLGTPSDTGGTLAQGEAAFYKINISDADQTLLVVFDSFADEGVFNELYISFEEMPTRADFDFSFSKPFEPDQRVLVPSTKAGTYYVLAYGASVFQPTEYIISAEIIDFSIVSIDQPRGGNAGNLTVGIEGAKFDRTATATLIAPGGIEVQSIAMHFTNQSKMFATFDLTDAAPGFYDLRIQKGNGQSSTELDMVEVVESALGRVQASIQVPQRVRINTAYSFNVLWGNNTLNDLPVPLLLVGSTQGFTLESNGTSVGARYTFLGIGTEDGPRGIIRPGQQEGRTFYSESGPIRDKHKLFVKIEGKVANEAFDWSSVEGDLDRGDLTSAEFDAAFAQLQNQVGPTWGDYHAMLVRNSDLLPSQLGDFRDPVLLLNLEFRIAQAAVFTSLSGRLSTPLLDVAIADQGVNARNDTTGDIFAAISLNDGRFIFPKLTPGDYSFQVTRAAIESVTGDVGVQDGEHVSDVTINLIRGGTISGIIRSAANGAALPNAEAFITRLDGTDPRMLEVDAEGRFIADRLPHGSYRITAAADGLATQTFDFVVNSDQPIEADLSLAAPASISFLVEPAAGFSLDGMVVYAIRDGDAIYPPIFAEREGDRFTMIGFGAGTYDIILTTGAPGQFVQDVVLASEQALDLGTIIYNPPPGPRNFVYLASAEAYLRAVFLPAITYRFGFETGAIWNTFLSTTPTTASPQLFYTDGDDIVEGSVVDTGFRDDELVNLDLKIAFLDAYIQIKKQFQDGTLDCDDIGPSGRYFNIESIISTRAKIDGLDSNFSNIFSIPGNIAGGVGRGDVYLDDRWIRGGVYVRKISRTQFQVESQLIYHVQDTVDFIPGDLGAGIEQVFTRPLRALEAGGCAYDVPFLVQLDDKNPEHKMSFSLNADDDCEDPDNEPPDDTDDEEEVDIPTSMDPNDILGPAGFGEEKWVPAAETLPYTIRFENDPVFATTSALVVRVTQTLDADIDFRTFRVGDFGFGDVFVDVPDGKAFYQTRLDLTETRGVFVDFASGIDVQSGEAFWELTTIDPETGEIPTDPDKGFLPPNIEKPEGEGFVKYSARAKRNSPSGTVVNAAATIVFDTNEPIDTPVIFNTLDAGIPSSSVTALPDQADDTTFLVSWTGADDQTGSGLAGYDIFVSENGSAFDLLLSNTTLTETSFVGKAGTVYAFYSVAKDNAGNVEPVPSTADATTRTPGGQPPSFDLGEPASVSEGVVFTRNVPFSDPDEGDVLTATVDYGDGSGVQELTLDADSTFTLNHVYADNATFTVTVVLTDSSANSTTDTLELTIDNAAPVVSAGADFSIDEGLAAVFAGSFTDSGSADTHTISWDFGDGATDTSGTLTPSHVYTLEGVYTVTLTVTDDDGASTSSSILVTVLDTADPAVSAFQVNDGSAQRSMVTSLTVTFSRPVSLQTGAVRVFNVTTNAEVSVNITPGGGGASAVLTPVSGSFDDGRYEVRLDASLITDSVGQTLAGGDQTLTFHRFFGDADGDRDVDALDLALFRTSYNTSQGNAKFLWFFDFDSNGTVNEADYIEFRNRLNKKI